MLKEHLEARKVLPEPKMLIGGAWVQGSKGARMEHLDPSTGRSLGEFAKAEIEDVDAAVAGAREAFPAWRKLPADQRRGVMLSIAAAIRKHQDELNLIAALESGQPIARNLALGVADQFEYYAGWADKLGGEVVQTYPRRALNYVNYEPLGVIAALVTYNGPMQNTAMKIAPALAAGNVAIVRPPELGPFGVVRLAEIFIEAGLPANVVSVLTGGPDVAAALTRHHGIDKISLTGGIVTARKVMEAAATHVCPVTMELGGKSANMVFDDADLDNPGFARTVMSVVGTAGQGCLYGTRLLVQDGIYDRTVEKVLEFAKSASIGDPLDPSVGGGPVISEQATKRILGYVEQASNTGAKVVTGGYRIEDGELKEGYFLQPTVIVDVDNKSRIAQEEIFGPVLCVTRFSTEEEGIELANDTTYGLHAYVHTRSIDRGHRVADELVAGGVSINSGPPMVASMPFGGTKQSGFGREGGRAAIEEFIHHKNIYVPFD